ncbi:MAG TPA: hypothetical protein VNZ94_01835 [Xanthobacteraceae bacterium]|nr:hypothetical protein [Xanthobacteraceae bacterium]
MSLYKSNKRQVNVHLSPEDFALLTKLAEQAGVTPTTCAKNIVLEVLRDDAAAHNNQGQEVNHEVA